MAPGCERSRPVVAGPGGAYAVALRSMHGGLCPVSYAPSPAPRARVSRVLLPAASSPCSASCTPCPRLPSSALRAPVSRVLLPAASSPCSASCVLHPVPPCPRAPVPVPAPRARARVHVLRVPRSAFCVPRPTPASSVFRVPHPHPRPRCPALCARGPAPASPAPRARGSVFCVPRTVARVPRPVSPPRTSGQVLPASASRRDEKKIGRLPRGTSRFCMHCSGARLTRACG
jgi:hypothetical protein